MPNILPAHDFDTLADHAADRADSALNATRQAADEAIDRLHDGVDTLRREVPGNLQRAASQVETMARRSIERARQSSAEVRARFDAASDATVGYIKDEPVKSVLIAAATGAAMFAVMSLFRRSDTPARR